MKLKYRLSDGEILCMGNMPNLVAGAGEVVENFNNKIPVDIEFYRRTSQNTLTRKTGEEIEAIKKSKEASSPGMFMKKFNNKFPDATPVEKYLAKSISKLAGLILEKDTD